MLVAPHDRISVVEYFRGGSVEQRRLLSTFVAGRSVGDQLKVVAIDVVGDLGAALTVAADYAEVTLCSRDAHGWSIMTSSSVMTNPVTWSDRRAHADRAPAGFLKVGMVVIDWETAKAASVRLGALGGVLAAGISAVEVVESGKPRAVAISDVGAAVVIGILPCEIRCAFEKGSVETTAMDEQ